MRRNQLLTAMLLLATTFLTSGCGERYLVFRPVGPVGRIELRLINLSIYLSAIIVVVVFLLLWLIVRRYRDVPGNKAPYEPEWSESAKLEVVWWAIPIVIVAILSVETARDTFALTRPPEQNRTPITVQVTSLDYKWLFQYPSEKVATVNYCVIPTNRPVQFILTSNAPMNSFWVPQLGGQEYTMPGMAMRLWLQADKPGDYYGHGANFSGQGFAHMEFHVLAKDDTSYSQWVRQTKATAPALTKQGYNQLIQPSIVGRMTYSSFPPETFKNLVMKDGGMYMKHDMSIFNQQSKQD